VHESAHEQDAVDEAAVEKLQMFLLPDEHGAGRLEAIQLQECTELIRFRAGIDTSGIGHLRQDPVEYFTIAGGRSQGD
jgi:hypothetical protein